MRRYAISQCTSTMDASASRWPMTCLFGSSTTPRALPRRGSCLPRMCRLESPGFDAPSCGRGSTTASPPPSGDELPHDTVEPGLPLEANAGPLRQPQGALFDLGVVGKAAEIPEHARIGLRA